MEKRLLVVGIDPGTTLGYAALDLNKEVMALKSSKNFGLNELLLDITKIGKVIAVGTDKAKIPHLVQLFSAKTGAKIFHPNDDLKAEEKKKLTESFETANWHQNDALASSLFAFNNIKATLDKIEGFVEDNNKNSIKEKITELVLAKGLSIKEAASLIENKDSEETEIIKKVVEENKMTQNDFMRLYRIIKRHERENYLLKRQNNNLKNYVKALEKRLNYAKKEHSEGISKKDSRNIKEILLKEKSINFLQNRLNIAEEDIKKSALDIKKLNCMLSKCNSSFILKKLDNLGRLEFERKKELLNIEKDDILLVENPSIISENVMAFLKDKVSIILTKNPISGKIREKYSFSFVDCKKIRMEDGDFFAIAPKKEIQELLKDSNVLKMLIEDYKKHREGNC